MSNLSSALKDLPPKRRIYVQCRLDGMTQTASMQAAGLKGKASDRLENDPKVQAAMVAACEDLAEEVQFGRREAHDMLMSAYQNAATATEQIAAVRELINLHGIAQPKKVEHEHTHKGVVSLEKMETQQLLKEAGLEHLTLEGEYEVVKDDDGGDNPKALPEM